MHLFMCSTGIQISENVTRHFASSLTQIEHSVIAFLTRVCLEHGGLKLMTPGIMHAHIVEPPIITGRLWTRSSRATVLTKSRPAFLDLVEQPLKTPVLACFFRSPHPCLRQRTWQTHYTILRGYRQLELGI